MPFFEVTIDGQCYTIPDHMGPGLLNYANYGRKPGDFLTAVLENDLMEAFIRADDHNRKNMLAYCSYLYANMPSSCRGSKDIVAKWLAKKEHERVLSGEKHG